MKPPTAAPSIVLGEHAMQPILSSVGVGRMALEDVAGAIAAAAADPDPGNMYMRMHYLLQALGQHDESLRMQARALTQRRSYRIADPARPALRLLAFMGPGNMQCNAPLEYVVDGSDVRLDLLYLTPGAPFPDEVPEHDVAIVAIGENAQNRDLLAQLDEVLASWPRPVLNRPRQVLQCARDAAYRLLADVPGLCMARTDRLARGQLSACVFPFTIRPVDTQGGAGLAKIASAPELAAYLDAHSEAEFYVAEFIDYAGADDQFRKARVALIDGRPYICHYAISSQWMVHYLTADMQDSAAKHAEEEAMMLGFDDGFGARHQALWPEIARRLGLDYVILDCGETRDGRLLVFEADTRGWIHACDPPELFPYKLPVMRRAFDAFRAMLLDRAARRR